MSESKDGGAGDAQLAAFPLQDEDNPDADAVKWIRAQFDAEVERLKAQGQRVVPLAVKNCSLAREGRQMINRVRAHRALCPVPQFPAHGAALAPQMELATAFDFRKVKQILVSEPVQCTPKPGFKYVNVVMFTDKPLPLIVPYIFDSGFKNDLRQWVFINTRMERARHKVGHFSSVD